MPESVDLVGLQVDPALTAPPVITAVPVGWPFPRMEVDLSANAVYRYLEAVGDQRHVHGLTGDEVVPPSGLVTLCLGACLRQIKLPEGSLHISQEMEAPVAVTIGEKLLLDANIEKRTDRAGVTIVTVGLLAKDQEGRERLRGKATLLMPGSEEDA